MRVAASAPGKLFLLGEYAVLAGSPALLAAVSVRASVQIASAPPMRWSLVTRQNEERRQDFVPGRATGVALLDPMLEELGADRDTLPPCRISLDTAAFFSPEGGRKRGLGSSAALLVALYGALGRWIGQRAQQPDRALATLRRLHDRFQGEPGSGGDLAASLHGGLIRYRLAAAGGADIGSVELPDGVAFACISTAQAASSARFVGLFRRWQTAHPQAAAARVAALDQVARAGCQAVEAGDGVGFLEAVGAYGDLLAELGRALGADVVTPEHQQLTNLAEQNGVIYKTSGAGGGDVGLAFARDPERLQAFVARARARGFAGLDIAVDPLGLVVEGPLDD